MVSRGSPVGEDGAGWIFADILLFFLLTFDLHTFFKFPKLESVTELTVILWTLPVAKVSKNAVV
jgi:hypothetical protein